jgi:DNA-binding transcriptional MerR regulator
MSYLLVRAAGRADAARLDLEQFAWAAGLHPDLVRRLVALGLLEPDRDADGALRFSRSDLATVARIQRLRAGFGLNYAALGLVVDLLDRVAVLECALRQPQLQTRLLPRETPRTSNRPIGG